MSGRRVAPCAVAPTKCDVAHRTRKSDRRPTPYYRVAAGLPAVALLCAAPADLGSARYVPAHSPMPPARHSRLLPLHRRPRQVPCAVAVPRMPHLAPAQQQVWREQPCRPAGVDATLLRVAPRAGRFAARRCAARKARLSLRLFTGGSSCGMRFSV
eukprot:6211496-Pleurochrysis_carterae.AAC.3